MNVKDAVEPGGAFRRTMEHDHPANPLGKRKALLQHLCPDRCRLSAVEALRYFQRAWANRGNSERQSFLFSGLVKLIVLARKSSRIPVELFKARSALSNSSHAAAQ